MASEDKSKRARSGSSPSMGRQAWVDAAMGALARGGLGAVAVEPLAASLGVTKGSFYWHFANRGELVEALLQRWEQVGTHEVIAALEEIPDPAQRIAMLLRAAVDDVAHLRAEATLSAAASAGESRVAEVVNRVNRERLSYVTGLYVALGVPKAEAARMALVVFGAYLGCVQLAAQGLLPQSVAALRRQVETLQRMLVPR